MSNTELIELTVTAVRNADRPAVQEILPTDTAAVEAAVRQQNPHMVDRHVANTVRSLTVGALERARANGSERVKNTAADVTVILNVARRIVPHLPLGAVVSYDGEAPSTVIARHKATFEYTVRTAGGEKLRAGTEYFTTI